MPAALNRDDAIAKVCDELEKGKTLQAICGKNGLPGRRTIHEWMDDDETIRTAIAHARDISFDVRAEKAVEDAKNVDDAAKARLAFDADRWFLAKMNPARYGERIQTAQTDVHGNDATKDPLEVIAELMAIAQTRKDAE